MSLKKLRPSVPAEMPADYRNLMERVLGVCAGRAAPPSRCWAAVPLIAWRRLPSWHMAAACAATRDAVRLSNARGLPKAMRLLGTVKAPCPWRASCTCLAGGAAVRCQRCAWVCTAGRPCHRHLAHAGTSTAAAMSFAHPGRAAREVLAVPASTAGRRRGQTPALKSPTFHAWLLRRRCWHACAETDTQQRGQTLKL